MIYQFLIRSIKINNSFIETYIVNTYTINFQYKKL